MKFLLNASTLALVATPVSYTHLTLPSKAHQKLLLQAILTGVT